jgi:hypothetical protein
MPKPTPPIQLFKRPFAESGARAQPPDQQTAPGRTSLKDGFPTETQLPLTRGGVAPNRLDFNGILHMLSAFAWWQQSGGMFSWSASLDYAVPSLVFHSGKLWWCLAANGPGNGAVAVPGTAPEVWRELLPALADQIGGGGSGGGDITTIFGGVPVGTIIAYAGASAPDGYLACDGGSFSASTYPKLYVLLGEAKTPDLRGYFVRGLGGASGARGTAQQDAGREIYGSAPLLDNNVGYDAAFNGFFYVDTSVPKNQWGQLGAIDADNYRCGVAASRCWGSEHTASEFRPLNKAFLHCVKHD